MPCVFPFRDLPHSVSNPFNNPAPPKHENPSALCYPEMERKGLRALPHLEKSMEMKKR